MINASDAEFKAYASNLKPYTRDLAREQEFQKLVFEDTSKGLVAEQKDPTNTPYVLRTTKLCKYVNFTKGICERLQPYNHFKSCPEMDGLFLPTTNPSQNCFKEYCFLILHVE